MENHSQSRTAATGSYNKIDYRTGVAVGTKNRLDISENHVTTMDFGYLKPVFSRMLFPDEDLTVETSQFTRLAPMPVPTFGTIYNKTRAFFVPFRVLLRDWLPFISNNYSYDSIGTEGSSAVPLTANFSWQAFCRSLIDHNVFENGSQNDYDIQIARYTAWNNRVIHYFKFRSREQKNAIDLLRCLGYNMEFYFDDYSSSDADVPLSALPLMAFAKLWLDWVVPSRFVVNHLGLRTLVNALSLHNLVTPEDIINLVFNDYSCYFDDDIFTTAFNNMSGDEVSRPLNFTLPVFGATSDMSLSGTEPTTEENKGFGANLSINDGDVITNLSIQSLGALQAMINRGKLAGTKIQEYMKVTYGIEPFNESLNLSTYLGVHSNEIQIGDVMATAGTTENALGDYAGRGIGYGSGIFKFHAKEHGMFIITNEIVPVASYPFGTRYDIFATDRLDFYQPELDNLGYEALSTSMFGGQQARGISGSHPGLDYTFAFVPRYAGYKVGQDSVTGDFRVQSLNADLYPWYLARPYESTKRTLTEEFVKVPKGEAFNGIFASQNINYVDHFYINFKHKVTRNTPLKPIGLSLSEHGRQVSVSPNN